MNKIELIYRNLYLERIIARLDKKMILVLVGQRHVGKSYMLKQLNVLIQPKFVQGKRRGQACLDYAEPPPNFIEK